MLKREYTVTNFIRLGLAISLIISLGLPIYNTRAYSAPAAVQQPSQAAVSATLSGNPILLIYNDSYQPNKFGRFLGEILRAEGFNNYDTSQVDSITGAGLAAYDVVVLAETSLTATQSNLLAQYVAGGGNLIAMRPDAQLNVMLGLGSNAGTLSNGYMAIQTSTGYGAGFTSDSLQLHTPATQYNGATAQVLGVLYSNATTPTTWPAVTINNYGSGQAVAFAYDLATSVVYTRQGNPAQTDVDADGDGIIRIVDMYYNWIDLNKMPLPQADIQQRFLIRLLNQLNLAKKPLPRFWYFPNAANSALIITSDAHGNPDSYYTNMMTSLGRFNAKTTFYMAQAGQPSAANVNNWRSQGFTFSTHPYKEFTPLSTGYDNVDNWFDSTYGTRTTRTVRVHRLQWQGWVEAAKIGLAHGYNLDYTPYRYGAWLKKPDNSWTQGYMTGSSLPMKFIDQNGQIVDNFGQYTIAADDQMLAANGGPEGLDEATAYQRSQQIIDASEAGDNQALTFQLHVDYYAGEQTWAENVLGYARSRNVPIIAGESWYDFTQNRYDSNFSNISWSSNQLSFSASVPTTQTGQTVQLPMRNSNANLTGLTLNGSPASYTTRLVRGENFAFVVLPAGTSSITASYTPDTTPPVISNIQAVPSTTQAQINWTTDEPASSTVNYGLTAALGSTASASGLTTGHSVALTGLTPGATYFYQIVSQDWQANSTNSAVLNFNTPTSQLVQDSFAQFSAGSFNNTAATYYNLGEIKLKSGLEDGFGINSLDAARWNSAAWVNGGTATFNSGVVTLAGAYLQSKSNLTPAGRTLSARIKFKAGVANQHFGFSPDLTSSYYIFSLPGWDPNNLYVRTNSGNGEVNTKLSNVNLDQWHTLDIGVATNQINYYLDGVLLATHTASLTGSLPVWLSSASISGQLQADWVRFNNYPNSGTFISSPLDAGNAVKWAALNWSGDLNGGTLQIQTRTSGNAENWTAWSAASSSLSQPVLSPVGRYLQYQATLTTSNPANSPQLNSITVGYDPVQVNQVAVTPASANIYLGDTAQFNATGYDAENNPLPGLVVNWSVANGGGTIDNNGLFTATTNGTFNNTVVASASNKSGTASVVITDPPPSVKQTTQAEFATGVFTNTTAILRANGEIKLKASLEDYFTAAGLDPAVWLTDVWTAGGTASLDYGNLSLKAAYARSQNPHAMTWLQGRVKFAGNNTSGQHFGFSPDLASSWILFSIPNADPARIYARTNINGVYQETPLTASLDAYHDFAFVIGGGAINYYVDGLLVATHTVTVTGNNYIWLSANSLTNGLSVDSVVTNKYPASGSYLSAALDAGSSAIWNKITAQLMPASGATVTVQARTSIDSTTWSAWSAAASLVGEVNLNLPVGRYLQYKLDLTATPGNGTSSPEVESITAIYTPYTPGPVASIKVTPATAALTGGATQQFQAQAFDSNNYPLNGVNYNWSTTGGGTIDANSGLYTAGQVGGSYPNSVIATSGGITGSASVTITITAPTISAVSPNKGPNNVNTNITISGANFQATPAVKLGETSLISVTFVSSSSLTAVVPAGIAAGVYTMTVTNPDGQTATRTNAYTAITPPTVSSVTPASADNAITRTITINGSNFVSKPTVRLGTTNLSGVTFISSTQLTAQVRQNFTPGLYNVTVTNPDGTAGTLTNGYRVTAAPTLSQSTQANFNAGTMVSTTLTLSGSTTVVNLTPTFLDNFTGTALNTGNWSIGQWVTGGTATVDRSSNGVVSVKGSYIKSNAQYINGVVEGRVRFIANAPSQSFGLATDLNSAGGPWAIFSVSSSDPSAVFAYTNFNGAGDRTRLSNVRFNTYYNMRIEVGTTGVTYYINDEVVATHNATTTTPLSIFLSYTGTSNNLQADWIRINKFSGSGTFTSSALNSGAAGSAWGTVTWAGSKPDGTGFTILTQTSIDGQNWSAWSAPISASGSPVTSPPGRYLRYQLNFTASSDLTWTPTMSSITFRYTTQP